MPAGIEQFFAEVIVAVGSPDAPLIPDIEQVLAAAWKYGIEFKR
jgi:hypothetical protein